MFSGASVAALFGLLSCLDGSLPRSAGAAEDVVPLSAEEVRDRWHGRLDGRHFRAEIHMEMELAGLHETRQMRVFRHDESNSQERVLVRFDSPPDLRNVGLLYIEHADLPNDYFLYVPATRRVRRLPASIADDDVYGIDLEFLGFGVAQTEPTEIRSLRRLELEGRRVYRLTERARNKNPRFDERITWLDAETFIPVRTEHVRDGRTVLTAETLAIARVQGIPTPLAILFEKPIERRRVELRVVSVDYEKEIPEPVFSIFTLTKARVAQP